MSKSRNLLFVGRGLSICSLSSLTRLKKLVGIIALSGCLYTSASCLPTRNQLNSTFSSGVLSGIEFALTLGVTNLLSPATTTTTTTTKSSTTGGTASTTG